MLSSLTIKNFALIDHQEIDFHRGHNVITGETGAGKSIIIGALQILLGARADKSQIRKGADVCEIGGVFNLTDQDVVSKLNRSLENNGIPICENGQLIIYRRLKLQSVANYVNSTPVTLKIIKEIGEFLIDIHGPYDQQLLFRIAKQLELLDKYTGIEDELEALICEYDRWLVMVNKVNDFQQQDLSDEHHEFVKFQLKNIADAHLVSGEDIELTERHNLAANNKQILEALNRCTSLLNRDNGVVSMLSNIMKDLQGIGELNISKNSELMKLLGSIMADIQNFDDELRIFESENDLDPDEFVSLEERLSVVENLKRKYGGSIKSVLEYAEKVKNEIDDYENYEYRLQELTKIAEQQKNAAMEISQKISNRRKKSAQSLAAKITKKLQVLGFKQASFEIRFKLEPLHKKGTDSIEFYISPNPGEDLRPLRKIGSSGEISRVMLAIKTILAKVDNTPILVFDEIDVNIGGTTAVTVGKEMKMLGEKQQVICITHLPQVAANADKHVAVEKITKNSRTWASLVTLNDDMKLTEICRMLGGSESNKAVFDHAKQLVN